MPRLLCVLSSVLGWLSAMCVCLYFGSIFSLKMVAHSLLLPKASLTTKSEDVCKRTMGFYAPHTQDAHASVPQEHGAELLPRKQCAHCSSSAGFLSSNIYIPRDSIL